MYDNAIEARDAGVNFAFLCGNSVFGVVPLLPSAEGQSHRIMRRESYFYGEAFAKKYEEARGVKAKYPTGKDGALLMGGRFVIGSLGGGDWTCANPDHWLYEGTDMKEGNTVQGLVGWEWHGDPAGDKPGMEFLTNGETSDGKGKSKPPHIATIYNGPKDNVVFNAGTIWWAQGLSSPPGHVLPAHKHNAAARPEGVDPRVQRMMTNVFNRFIT